MLFWKILRTDKFEDADFKYDNSFLKILAQKYSNKTFLVPNLVIFCFLQNFGNRKIWGCWFQIWLYCFQIPIQKYPNQTFLVRNLRIFIFPPNFATRQVWRCCFQIWQYFQIPAPKYANLAFLVLNLGIFIFHSDYKYDNILSTFQPKDPNRAFLVTIFFFFLSFWLKLYSFTNSRVLFKNLMLK